MIPFPHIWATDPATGQLRCYRQRREAGSPILAEALADRIRTAVRHVAAANVVVSAARSLLHGWGEVSGDGAAELLERISQEGAAHRSYMVAVEAELVAIMAKWDGGEPADYTAAKAKSLRELLERTPHADLSLLDTAS